MGLECSPEIGLIIGTKIVAILEMLWSILMSIQIVHLFIDAYEKNGQDTYIGSNAIIVLSIVGAFLVLGGGFFPFVMGLVLMQGARLRHKKKCKVWLIVHTPLLMIEALVMLLSIYWDANHTFQIQASVSCVGTFACLCIVCGFYMHLRSDSIELESSEPHLQSHRKSTAEFDQL